MDDGLPYRRCSCHNWSSQRPELLDGDRNNTTKPTNGSFFRAWNQNCRSKHVSIGRWTQVGVLICPGNFGGSLGIHMWHRSALDLAFHSIVANDVHHSVLPMALLLYLGRAASSYRSLQSYRYHDWYLLCTMVIILAIFWYGLFNIVATVFTRTMCLRGNRWYHKLSTGNNVEGFALQDNCGKSMWAPSRYTVRWPSLMVVSWRAPIWHVG